MALQWITLVFGLVALSDALPDGMPMSACNSLYPQHYTLPQSSGAPYTLTATPEGDHLVVVLEADDPEVDGNHFRGFAIQGIEDWTVVGSFEANANTEGVKFLDCFNDDDTVTHASNAPLKSISVNYHPPEGSDPSAITFKASVVHAMLNFWTDVEARVVTSK